MGFRFRKSLNVGPFRLNRSKTGMGWMDAGLAILGLLHLVLSDTAYGVTFERGLFKSRFNNDICYRYLHEGDDIEGTEQEHVERAKELAQAKRYQEAIIEVCQGLAVGHGGDLAEDRLVLILQMREHDEVLAQQDQARRRDADKEAHELFNRRIADLLAKYQVTDDPVRLLMLLENPANPTLREAHLFVQATVRFPKDARGDQFVELWQPFSRLHSWTLHLETPRVLQPRDSVACIVQVIGATPITQGSFVRLIPHLQAVECLGK